MVKVFMGRVYNFSNQWTFERTVYLTPSISLDFNEGWCLDVSFLIFKFYTYRDFDKSNLNNGE
jgi:hypothetical protein